MFIKNTMKIKDKRNGQMYECFVQSVDLNFNKTYVMRYNIGINDHFKWHHICSVYSNEDFNNNYEVIEDR